MGLTVTAEEAPTAAAEIVPATAADLAAADRTAAA